MNKMQRWVASIVFCCIFSPQSGLYASEFQKQNPDVKKYEFARSYISALSYFYTIYQRWQQRPPKKIYAGNDDKIIKASINYLAMDNANLRIAKNYLTPYLGYPNALMRKVADTVAVACDQEIAINNQEKMLWGKWGDLKKAGQGTAPKEKQFVST